MQCFLPFFRGLVSFIICKEILSLCQAEKASHHISFSAWNQSWNWWSSGYGKPGSISHACASYDRGGSQNASFRHFPGFLLAFCHMGDVSNVTLTSCMYYCLSVGTQTCNCVPEFNISLHPVCPGHSEPEGM